MSFLSGSAQPVFNATQWTGRETTFMENFEATLRDENLRMGANGLEAAFDTDWQENARAFREATGADLHTDPVYRGSLLGRVRELEHRTDEDLPFLERPFTSAEDALIPSIGPDLGALSDEQLAMAEEKLNAYRAANPGDTRVKTFEEMWEAIKARNLKNREVAASIGDRASAMGAVGGFTAGLVASVNPETNFLNFITLGIGGFGPKVWARITGEVGASAAIETVNQFTGVADRQDLLGTPTTNEEKLAQIAMAGVGAGLIRGGVEGAGPLARGVESKVAPERAFAREMNRAVDTTSLRRSALDDYRDAVLAFDPQQVKSSSSRAAVVAEQNTVLFARANPYENTSAGEDLHFDRFQEVGGPIAANLKDRLMGSSAPVRDMGVVFREADYDATVTVQKTLREANKDPHVIELARSYNTPLINKFEKLNREVVELRRWVDELRAREAPQRTDDMLAESEADARALQERAEQGTGRRAAKARERLAELQETIAGQRAELERADTPSMRRLRDKIAAKDLELREVSEDVSAVFKRARETLDAQAPVTKPAVDPNLRSVLDGLVDRQELDPAFPVRSALEIISPKRINGKTYAESADDLVRTLEEVDPRAEALHAAEVRAVTDTVDETANTVDLGRELGEVDLDTTRIQINDSADEPVTVSLRDYLADNELDDELLRGMTTCAPGVAP